MEEKNGKTPDRLKAAMEEAARIKADRAEERTAKMKQKTTTINALFLLFIIVGILCGCATPGSLRQDGPAFTFNAAKGMPQEFGRCVVEQLDEMLVNVTHTLRDKSNGNATVLSIVPTIPGAQELISMLDINKTDNGIDILVYFASSNPSRDYGLFPRFAKALNACGAKESAILKKE